MSTEDVNNRARSVNRALLRNPGFVPVELTFEKPDPDLRCSRRYLLRPDMSMGQFLSVLRARMILKPSQGVYLLVNKTLPPVTASMGDLYAEHKDEAGMLVCMLCKETTFG